MLDKEELGGEVFRWVAVHGLRLFLCYWSRNSYIQDFIDFVNRFEKAIRSELTEALLTVDFNAKHPDWGCPRSDKKGEILMDMNNSAGMVICNRSTQSTFNKGSIIDLTIATPRTAQSMSK